MQQRDTNQVTTIDLLLLIFIVLKLVHVIDWSWWLVLAPLWIVLALVILAAAANSKGR